LLQQISKQSLKTFKPPFFFFSSPGANNDYSFLRQDDKMNTRKGGLLFLKRKADHHSAVSYVEKSSFHSKKMESVTFF
jgi:hypothetical protein